MFWEWTFSDGTFCMCIQNTMTTSLCWSHNASSRRTSVLLSVILPLSVIIPILAHSLLSYIQSSCSWIRSSGADCQSRRQCRTKIFHRSSFLDSDVNIYPALAELLTWTIYSIFVQVSWLIFICHICPGSTSPAQIICHILYVMLATYQSHLVKCGGNISAYAKSIVNICHILYCIACRQYICQIRYSPRRASPFSPFIPFSPFSPFARGQLSLSTNTKTTKFWLHDGQMVNGLRKISWASIFRLILLVKSQAVIPIF